MEIVEIEEKAEYIKELFEKEKYDSFYLYEARVKTKLDYYVNGFKIILMFNRENISRLLEMNNLPVKEEDVSALFMNVVYEHETLSVTTGTSLKIFTMDKTLEHIWDDTIKKYYI